MNWEDNGKGSIDVTLRFRDDAPSYGCEIDAFNDENRIIGFLIAKSLGQTERVMTMQLDEGTVNDVKKVKVTDCDA